MTFRNCTNLTNIILPSGLTHIWNTAFRGCKNLTSVTFRSGVTHIGVNAFRDCERLILIILDSDDENELARLRALLPNRLKEKVILKSEYEKQIRFQVALGCKFAGNMFHRFFGGEARAQLDSIAEPALLGEIFTYI